MKKITLLFSLLVAGLLITQANAANEVLISGTVQAGGNNVTAGWVEISKQGGPTAGAELGSNGSYSITRDSTEIAWTAGQYTLRVIPDTTLFGGYLSSTQTVNLTPGTPLSQNVNLSAVGKQIRVRVTNENEEPVEGEVRVTGTGGGAGLGYIQTLSNGQATITVNPAGAPYLVNVTNCRGEADSADDCDDWYSAAEAPSVTFSSADSVAETQDVDVAVQITTAIATGSFVDPDGNGFSGLVDLYNSEHTFRGWMSSDGTYTVYAVPGVYNFDLLPRQTMENPNVVRNYYSGTAVLNEGSNNFGRLETSYESSNLVAVLQDDSGNNLGETAVGMVVNVWNASTGGEWRKIDIMPGANGQAGSEVHEGVYRVTVSDPAGNYFPLVSSQEVAITDENQEATVNFPMQVADAAATVTVEQSDGSRAADVNSYVNCYDETQQISSGAQITRGQAELSMLAGTYDCSVATPTNGTSSVEPFTVTVAEGANATVTTSEMLHDATVSGTVVDQTSDPVTLGSNSEPLTVVLEGETFGRFQTEVNDDGTYSATVPPDTYTLTVSSEETVPMFGMEAQTVTIASAATEANVAVETIIPDSTITATVFTPGGEDPLPFAAVTCSYLPDGSKGDFEGGRVVEVSGTTNAAGEVSIPVVREDGDVSLRYDCSVAAPEGEGYITPVTQEEIKPGKEIEFTVYEPKATLEVTYDLPADSEVSSAQCQAWVDGGTGTVTASDDDGDGKVELPVSRAAGEQWQVSCSGADGDDFFAPTTPAEVTVPNTGEKEVTVSLSKEADRVPDATSSVFDGTTERTLELDSVALDIPSNAIPSDGNVTVTVTPTPDDLRQNEENRILGIPVNVRAFDDNGSVRSKLDQPVDVTLPYDEAEVTDRQALETDLVPKYYNEASGTWEVIDGFTHDLDQHTISFSTEHFTQFALVYNERIAGTAPNKVKNVRARFTKKLRVTWKKVNQAETYDVQLLKQVGKKFKQAKLFTDVTGRSTMIAKKWLKAGKTYRLRVRSIGSNGLYSAWSKPQKVRIP